MIRYSDAPPLTIAFYRVFLASLILFALKPAVTFRCIRAIDRRIALITVLGGFFLALHFAAWITSLSYTTIANSVVLVNSAPLTALVLSHFVLKERVSSITVGAVLFSLAGAGIIGWGDLSTGGEYFTGDVLALVGGFAGAAYLVCGRVVRPRLSFTPFLVLVYGFSALFLSLFCIIAGSNFFGYSRINYLLFVGLAVLPTIGGHSLFLYALRYMRAYLVNLGFLGEPVGAALLAFLFFHEVPTWFFYAGGIVIIAGSVTAILYEGSLQSNAG